jgi:hypothetical protein
MKNERILSYQLSQCLTKADLETVAGAGYTHSRTLQVTHRGAWDSEIDATLDV